MRPSIPRLALPLLALPLLALAPGATGCGAALGGVTPPGSSRLELRLVAKTEAEGFKVSTWDGKVVMFVEKNAPMNDRDVASVKLSKLPDGTPAIDLQLDQTGSIALEDVTAKNIGRRMAILVDGKIVIAPTIKETITGGKMTIAGFSASVTATLYEKLKR